MLYGWLEVGLSNNLLFQNENDEDIIMRTVYNTNKIILGNTEGTNKVAAVYIYGNNVGVRKVPDANTSLDVNGNIVAKDIQIGMSNYTGNLIINGNIILKDAQQQMGDSMQLEVVSSNGQVNIKYNDVNRIELTDNDGITVHDNMIVSKDVYAPSFNVTSDVRLKTHIQSSHVSEDIKNLSMLQVKNYTIHDRYHKGFLAQDVKDILPYVVSQRKGVIPLHIYAFYNNEMEQLENINMDISGLHVGDELVLASVDPSVKTKFITSIQNISNTVIKLDHMPITLSGNVIIEGKYVDDLYTIDMNQITALNTSVLQNILSRLEKLENFIYENK